MSCEEIGTNWQHGKTLFKDLRAIEIQGKNLEHEIIGYSRWCSSMKREKEHDRLYMTTQGVTISEQHDTIATLRDELRRNRNKLATLHSTVATLQDDLHSTRAKLESVRTPPGLASSMASSQHAQGARTESDHPSKSPKVTESDRPSKSLKVNQGQEFAAPCELVYGAEARTQAESCSNKNKYILVVLQALYRDGFLRAPGFEKIDVPDQYNEKQLMRNTLELLEVVLSDKEGTVFMSDGATDMDLESREEY
jgi:hypothetical protein